MDEFKWEKSMSVGVDKLDQQHRVLIRIINRIGPEAEKGDTRSIVENSINLLIKYAREHFVEEEEYLILADYIHLEEHQHKHKILIEQVLKLSAEIDRGVDIDLFALRIFLQNWLIDHIMQEDKKYSQYLISLPH